MFHNTSFGAIRAGPSPLSGSISSQMFDGGNYGHRLGLARIAGTTDVTFDGADIVTAT